MNVQLQDEINIKLRIALISYSPATPCALVICTNSFHTAVHACEGIHIYSVLPEILRVLKKQRVHVIALLTRRPC